MTLLESYPDTSKYPERLEVPEWRRDDMVSAMQTVKRVRE